MMDRRKFISEHNFICDGKWMRKICAIISVVILLLGSVGVSADDSEHGSVFDSGDYQLTDHLMNTKVAIYSFKEGEEETTSRKYDADLVIESYSCSSSSTEGYDDITIWFKLKYELTEEERAGNTSIHFPYGIYGYQSGNLFPFNEKREEMEVEIDGVKYTVSFENRREFTLSDMITNDKGISYREVCNSEVFKATIPKEMDGIILGFCDMDSFSTDYNSFELLKNDHSVLLQYGNLDENMFLTYVQTDPTLMKAVLITGGIGLVILFFVVLLLSRHKKKTIKKARAQSITSMKQFMADKENVISWLNDNRGSAFSFNETMFNHVLDTYRKEASTFKFQITDKIGNPFTDREWAQICLASTGGSIGSGWGGQGSSTSEEEEYDEKIRNANTQLEEARQKSIEDVENLKEEIDRKLQMSPILPIDEGDVSIAEAKYRKIRDQFEQAEKEREKQVQKAQKELDKQVYLDYCDRATALNRELDRIRTKILSALHEKFQKTGIPSAFPSTDHIVYNGNKVDRQLDMFGEHYTVSEKDISSYRVERETGKSPQFEGGEKEHYFRPKKVLDDYKETFVNEKENCKEKVKPLLDQEAKTKRISMEKTHKHGVIITGLILVLVLLTLFLTLQPHMSGHQLEPQELGQMIEGRDHASDSSFIQIVKQGLAWVVLLLDMIPTVLSILPSFILYPLLFLFMFVAITVIFFVFVSTNKKDYNEITRVEIANQEYLILKEGCDEIRPLLNEQIDAYDQKIKRITSTAEYQEASEKDQKCREMDKTFAKNWQWKWISQLKG